MDFSVLIYFAPFLLALVGAMGGKLTGFKSSETIFGIILIILGVLGAVHWHVGWDWQGYELYFSSIPINGFHDFWGSGYTANLSGLRFEPGYYVLSYIVKLLGGTNAVIVAAASIFNVFALSRLITVVPNNRCFALLFYICFCFILLHFAMVRQSFAVGFAYFACREIINGGKLVKALIFILVGMLFQTSALMYLPVLFTYNLSNRKAKVLLSCVAIFVMATVAFKLDVSAALVGLLYDTLGFGFFSKYYAYVNVQHTPTLLSHLLIVFSLLIILDLILKPTQDPKLNRLATLTFNATVLGLFAFSLFYFNPSIRQRILFLAAPLQGIWLANRLLTAGFAERISVFGAAAGYSISVHVHMILSSLNFLAPYKTVFEKYFKYVFGGS